MSGEKQAEEPAAENPDTTLTELTLETSDHVTRRDMQSAHFRVASRLGDLASDHRDTLSDEPVDEV